MNDYNTIFSSRYYAEKAKKTSPFLRSSDKVVKVCAGGDKVGYVVMNPMDYNIWKKQK